MGISERLWFGNSRPLFNQASCERRAVSEIASAPNVGFGSMSKSSNLHRVITMRLRRISALFFRSASPINNIIPDYGTSSYYLF